MHNYEYVKTLPLTDAQKQLINEESYENAPTLYLLCKAMPVAIAQWLGLNSLDALADALWAQMTPAEQQHCTKELEELENL